MADSGIGQPSDPKATDTTSSWSVIALLKKLIDSVSSGSAATVISGPLGRRSDATSVSAALSTEDTALVGALTETAPATDTASSGLNGRLQRIAQRLTTLLAVFPTTLDTNSGVKSASTLRVVLATDQVALTTPMPTKETRSSTATRANVAGNAGSVTILASNANRLGMSVFNDSGAILYLDTTGGTATTSNYTLQIAPSGYFEMPFNYTGLITGIWASATGNARVVEYT